ncbi:cistern family PEP-CTERM protein [Sandarakinorhabdus sp.]|uniref:cistern family PEP-CTERM protein n=1 Tax=Sandarakinorhabdus sp. TaxID=1916663 RepID=UPI00333FB59F
MNNLVRLAAIAMVAVSGSGAAQATAVLTGQFAKVGLFASNAGTALSLVKVEFQGVSSGSGTTGRQYSNISGTLNLQLNSVGYVNSGTDVISTWNFTATVANTSKSPMTSVRLSTFGFSTAAALASGNNPAFLNISSPAAETTLTPTAGPVFNKMFINNSGGSNFPNVTAAGTSAVNSVQVGFTDGTNNCCTGGGGGGLNLGDPATSTAFSLAFKGPSNLTALTLHNFAVRFQALSGTAQRIGIGSGTDTFSGASGVGIVTKLVDPVPEPSSWAMLIAGFGLVGATLRRRRMTVAA